MIPWLCELTHASSAHRKQRLQGLWSGYGEIVRYRLHDAPMRTVIVKHIAPPVDAHHPVGWSTDRSHQRKLKSYEVERAWYRDWSSRCEGSCRVPRWLGETEHEGGWLIALEDLDGAGFPHRHRHLEPAQVDACLAWLAAFHARFLHATPEGLWPKGTYWHLQTRPDELDAMEDRALADAAGTIDALLESCPYRTLVHGDAKVANFCFGAHAVAAVDFQYVGGGNGMQDVAYFLGSCLDSDTLERTSEHWLDVYFGHLAAHTAEPVEAAWRPMYAVAWADFIRFLAGWSPGHHKVDRHGLRLTAEVMASL